MSNTSERTWVNVDHIMKIFTATDLRLNRESLDSSQIKLPRTVIQFAGDDREIWTNEDPIELLQRIDRLIAGPV